MARDDLPAHHLCRECGSVREKAAFLEAVAGEPLTLWEAGVPESPQSAVRRLTR